MVIHIILENGEEVSLISFCKKHNLDFMDCCIRFCSGENFDEILNLPSDQIKIIRFKEEE